MHQLELFKGKFARSVRSTPKKIVPKEFKVVALRDCPLPWDQFLCDSPQRAATYWRQHIATTPQFNPDCECVAVLLLNTRKKLLGHHIVSTGLLDQSLVHAREAFRAAIISAAHSIVLMHNHPSGDPDPSDSDVRTTRDMIRTGRLVKIEVVDHIIIGHGSHSSLREKGYFQI